MGLGGLHLPKPITCLRQKCCPLYDLVIFKWLPVAPQTRTHAGAHKCDVGKTKDTGQCRRHFLMLSLLKKSLPARQGRLSVYLTRSSHLPFNSLERRRFTAHLGMNQLNIKNTTQQPLTRP